MKIAIDAKQYFDGPVSTRVILQQLLPELFSLFPEVQWLILLNQKDRNKIFPFAGENITLQYVWTPTNMLANIFIIGRHLRRHRVDLEFLLMFSPLFLSRKSVVFVHDVLFRDFPQYFTWKERAYFLPMRFVLPNVARIVCTTRYVAERVAQLGYSTREKISIVPLAISGEFQPLAALPPEKVRMVQDRLSLPAEYVLFVGRLNVRKNIGVMLQAFKLIRSQSTQLVIVGKEDWKTPDLTSLLSDPILKDRVTIYRDVDDGSLGVVYARATIMCYPSFAEGFGIPPLEAMASGVPVIVSNRTAIPEVCGDAAIYFDPTDPQALASSIDQLLENPSMRSKYAAKGLAHAKDVSWRQTALRLMSVFMQAKST